jgi:nucleotide-binding universal stress UspA family protein
MSIVKREQTSQEAAVKRVLVPLDESGITESVLPSAQRVAGPDGEIILIRAQPPRARGSDLESAQVAAETYLGDEAAVLQARGAHVRTKDYPRHTLDHAVREGIREFNADLVAVATTGDERARSVGWGDPAWRLLAHSTVPILIRHATATPDTALEHGTPHVLVPLDGSELAERAVPLASELAAQWKAPITLARVVHGEGDREAAQSYLREVAARARGDVHSKVLVGAPVDTLAQAAIDWKISDVVMTSHGRTGLARVLFGSVAAGLIHALVVPIITIPALAVSRELRAVSNEL